MENARIPFCKRHVTSHAARKGIRLHPNPIRMRKYRDTSPSKPIKAHMTDAGSVQIEHDAGQNRGCVLVKNMYGTHRHSQRDERRIYTSNHHFSLSLRSLAKSCRRNSVGSRLFILSVCAAQPLPRPPPASQRRSPRTPSPYRRSRLSQRRPIVLRIPPSPRCLPSGRRYFLRSPRR